MNVQYEAYDQSVHSLSEQMMSLSMESHALRQITNRSNVDPEIQRRLDHIDQVAKMLEGRIAALEDLVRQDLAAVQSLLPIIREFQGQTRRVDMIIEHLEAQENQQQPKQHEYKEAEEESTRLELQEQPQNQQQHKATTPYYNTRSRAKAQPHPEKVIGKKLTRPRASVRRDSLDMRKKPAQSEDLLYIRLRRVTQTELNTVSKMTRGRISLIAVNDALMDIERFLRNRNSPNNNNSHNKTDLLRVTEQELRQCCAFFRSGEATARTVLQVLRSLHRLKQIPCKRENTTVYELVLE